MTTLCTYILTNDTGLAPNPFWDWCTLAVCTPNRQGAKLAPNDWIAGFTTKREGHRLIYVMEVAERIHMDEYFNDQRFSRKKPNLRGAWQQKCGDNFYSQGPDGLWLQHRNRFHIGHEYLVKDTRKPYIFASERFWYFGRAAETVPAEFRPLIGGHGIRVNHAPDLVRSFLAWVEVTHKTGIHGLPIHNPDLIQGAACTGSFC